MENPIEEAGSLFNQARKLHQHITLCGHHQNELLDIPERLFQYLHATLRDECPLPPNAELREWERLIALLKAHWILPLLYWKIARLPAKYHPPAPIYATLKKAYHWSASRCLQAEFQIRELLTLFGKENISFLVMKGPAFGRMVYPEPALRPSSDLDLLVSPDQVATAGELLSGHGYRLERKGIDLFQDHHREEVFLPPMGGTHYRSLELHWAGYSVSDGQRGDSIAQLFARAVEIQSESVRFLALDPIDALIQAAGHAIAYHYAELRLSWCYDAALLFQKIDSMNATDALMRKSHAYQATQSVETMLRFSHFWTSIPSSEQLAALFGNEPPELPLVANAFTPRRRVKRYLSHLSLNKESLLRAVKILFPGTLYMQSTYPKSGSFALLRSHLSRWGCWVRALLK